MFTVNPNKTFLGDIATVTPADSRSVDTPLEVELFERARRQPKSPAQDSYQASTVQGHPNIRSLFIADVSSDIKEQWKPTCFYKLGPTSASLEVKQTRDIKDFMQSALAAQATRELEEVFPNLDFHTVTSPDYQRNRARDGSTNSEEYSSYLKENIINKLKETVHSASVEVFADGMESTLSQEVSMLIETYGDLTISAIEHILALYYDRVEIVGEVLRQLGYIEDSQTHRSRLTALVAHLESSDPRVRDAASLGLAALDDPASIDAVKDAISRETTMQLRINLELVLNQLQSTQWQAS